VSPSEVVGRFRTSDDYPNHRREVLRAHELGEPLGHVHRSFVVQGAVHETVAYFDMDLYEPIREVPQTIGPYLAWTALAAFDELAHPKWLGETAVLREVLDLRQIILHQIPGRELPLIYLRWNE
jgi:hypothetical protein